MDHSQESEAPAARYSSYSIASLILSCLSIILGPFGFVPGIIFGYVARSELRANPNLAGKGFAVAGLVIGYVFLGLFALCLLLFIGRVAAF